MIQKMLILTFAMLLTYNVDAQDWGESINEEKSEPVYTEIDNMPEYPGGIEKLLNYLASNIKYPKEAKTVNIEGRVTINFIVETDGSVSNVRVMKGIGGGCDEEAKRVVENMPKWKPGIQDNKPVRVSYNLPIKFSIEEKAKGIKTMVKVENNNVTFIRNSPSSKIIKSHLSEYVKSLENGKYIVEYNIAGGKLYVMSLKRKGK